MAPSQLKQLKASLRDHGVLGPQKSKKERKAHGKDATKRLQRNAALEGIRERFNPFEAKAPARKDKFDVASGKPTKTAVGRPGVTRGLGEERRRDTLLKEMQSRNKVGGLLDRRFGENDPTMTPEERAAERFARTAMRTSKKNSMFNLEDDSDGDMELTHGGRSLAFDEHTRDDFNEKELGLSDEDDFEQQDDRPKKRLRLDAEDAEDANMEDDEEAGDVPERRKTKNEVMKEVIAKSKMYKAERQAAKADDDDLRLQLDKGMPEFYDALREHKPVPRQLPSPPTTDSEPAMDPGRAAMLAGKSREDAEKEYEANLRQLKLDARSKPSVRTKTEEEKAAEEKARLEELERKRVRRMMGEAESSDDDDVEQDVGDAEDEEVQDDAEAFGLAQPQYAPRPQLDVEDEDEFVFDDIIASGSDADLASGDDSEGSDDDFELVDDGDDDFINGLVLPKTVTAAPEKISSSARAAAKGNLAYTFPCPETHDELLEITKNTDVNDLPTIVQRIRALYHKGLAEGNDEKLANFAAALTEHIAYLPDNISNIPFSVLESLIRHLHSMAKTQPEQVGSAFRDALKDIAEQRSLELSPGDLMVLTAISTIFPTSDQFHPVVTPAMLTIARYLAQSTVNELKDLAVGAYCCSLALKYQSVSLRFVPEVVTYIGNALAILAPIPFPAQHPDSGKLSIPLRLPETSLRVKASSSGKIPKKLSFQTLLSKDTPKDDKHAEGLVQGFLNLTSRCIQVWTKKTALPELIAPLQTIITHISKTQSSQQLSQETNALLSKTLTHIQTSTTNHVTTRTPLLLHNHKPLAIKSSYPQFVDNYNPSRHYDPDRERAEMAKLKAEHKRERKGAMRELRKDANFVAREQLREKKAKDEAYEKKFRRLVAEIQGEEGKEAKDYEREKAKRKRK